MAKSLDGVLSIINTKQKIEDVYIEIDESFFEKIEQIQTNGLNQTNQKLSINSLEFDAKDEQYFSKGNSIFTPKNEGYSVSNRNNIRTKFDGKFTFELDNKSCLNVKLNSIEFHLDESNRKKYGSIIVYRNVEMIIYGICEISKGNWDNQ